MRYAVAVRAVAVVVAVACGACGASPPPPPPPRTIANAPRHASCDDAAAGLDRVVRAVGTAPASGTMFVRCHDDAWSVAATTCFARMTSAGELARCAGELADDARERLFRQLEEPGDEPVVVLAHVARLANVHAGIPECDEFIAAVARAFTCAAIPLEDRMLLGATAADFSPMHSTRASQRMAQVCSHSLSSLRQQVAIAGCGS